MFFGAALATAAPAAAIDDPTRPDARVTHGPSCRPGGLVVEVVAGTAPYSVRLATTRTPSGEDEATLQPGQTVVLTTADVVYGETIDGQLEFAALDGTGVTFVDELEEYSFTRPTKEDCDAIADPSSSAPTSGGAAPTASAVPSNSGGAAPPSSDAPPSTSAAPGGAAPAAGGGGAAHEVAAGDTVTLQGSGFQPGEVVTFQLRGSDVVLGTATAGPDGTVRTEVRIPDGTAAGPATVDLFGTRSEIVTDVHLQVAAAESPVLDSGSSDIVPLVAAAVALVAAVGGLVSVAGRQRPHHPTTSSA